jgi:hypothetical protein
VVAIVDEIVVVVVAIVDEIVVVVAVVVVVIRGNMVHTNSFRCSRGV